MIGELENLKAANEGLYQEVKRHKEGLKVLRHAVSLLNLSEPSNIEQQEIINNIITKLQ